MRILGPLVAMIAALSWYTLDSHGLVPLQFRDRPWPFAVVALLGVLLATKGRPRMRGADFASLAVALTVLAGFATAVRWRYELPAAVKDLGIAMQLPPLVLADARNQPFDLGSLKGHPTLLVIYRGTW